MRLRSRLSGREIEGAPQELVQDLFETRELPSGPAVRVVPGGLEVEGGSAFLGSAPEAIDTAAIERIVEPLRVGVDWSVWVEALPLTPRIDEQASLQPLDKEILAHLPHLQHVCHRPRLHLRVEEERQSVARARRIPARAVASLVSHPEDWEHRTLRSIRPARVLATQVEDEWNLYENRVAARLLDHLIAWVDGRLEVLRRIDDMAQNRGDFDDETRGSHWRGKRIFALWGRSFTDDALRQELARTMKTMERLRRDLQALFGSPLYREVPRGTFVPAALRPTNILVNDPHYRKVAALWRAWARHGHHPQPTRAELRARRQAESRSFQWFALLLVVQALSGLGYRPEPGTALPGAGSVALKGPLGPARLRIADGALHFEIDSAALRLLPILSPVGRDWAVKVWRQIQDEVPMAPETALLLLGRSDDLDGVDPHTARAFAGWESPRIVLISPWSLDCAERVARVLREWETLHRFGDYPPRMQVRTEPEVPLPDWMKKRGDTIAVVSPASAEQQKELSLLCQRKKIMLVRDQAEARKAGRAVDPGRLQVLDQLVKLAGRASDLEPWRVCPLCGNVTGNDFDVRPASGDAWKQWAWWCRCDKCSSEWGTRVCRTCNSSYPVLIPSMKRPAPEQGAPQPGWIDRVYGRDVWAEPCWDPDVTDVYRCSRCGHCPGGGCSRCERASPSTAAR